MSQRLSSFLPFQLSVLSNCVSDAIATRYSERFSLTISQWRIVAVLGEHPGLSATELTERTGMDKVAISRGVSSLVQDGRVKRESSQSDGRTSELYLTTEGLELYEAVWPLAREYEDHLLQNLSDHDREELVRLLELLANAASPGRSLW